MAHYTRFGALAGVIAAASMAFTPAQAAEMLPSAPAQGSAFGIDFSQSSAFDTGIESFEEDNAEYRRRWRGYRRYRRGRIDGGDVLAGVLVLGGIAAIASAASNNNRREREYRRRYEDRRYDDRRYDNRRSNPRTSDGSGIDNAVSQCLAEIEQDVRVETVDGASRVASGWIVSGTLFNGSGFSCQIGNNGRISNIDYNGFSGVGYDGQGYGSGEAAEGQWSDANYAEARANIGTQSYTSADIRPLTPPASTVAEGDPQPAYPGGPLPGEEGYPGG